MIKLINNSKQTLGLPGVSFALPIGGGGEVTPDTFEKMKQNKTFNAWLEQGIIIVESNHPKEQIYQTDKPAGVEIKGSKGWFRVYVGGVEVSDKKLRKPDAKKLADEYR